MDNIKQYFQRVNWLDHAISQLLMVYHSEDYGNPKSIISAYLDHLAESSLTPQWDPNWSKKEWHEYNDGDKQLFDPTEYKIPENVEDLTDYQLLLISLHPTLSGNGSGLGKFAENCIQFFKKSPYDDHIANQLGNVINDLITAQRYQQQYEKLIDAKEEDRVLLDNVSDYQMLLESAKKSLFALENKTVITGDIRRKLEEELATLASLTASAELAPPSEDTPLLVEERPSGISRVRQFISLIKMAATQIIRFPFTYQHKRLRTFQATTILPLLKNDELAKMIQSDDSLSLKTKKIANQFNQLIDTVALDYQTQRAAVETLAKQAGLTLSEKQFARIADKNILLKLDVEVNNIQALSEKVLTLKQIQAYLVRANDLGKQVTSTITRLHDNFDKYYYTPEAVELSRLIPLRHYQAQLESVLSHLNSILEKLQSKAIIAELINPADIKQTVRQLISISREKFLKITDEELLNPKNYGNREQCPALMDFREYFQQLHAYTVDSITSFEDIDTRTVAMERWIIIANACYEAGDFHSFQAILSGLNNTAIYRLSATKQGLSDHAKSLLKSFQDHQQKKWHVQPTVLVGIMRASPNTTSPFIGAYQTEFTVAKEKNPTMPLQNVDEAKQLLQDIKKYRKNKIDTVESIALADKLKLFTITSDFDNRQFARSRAIEPKEAIPSNIFGILPSPQKMQAFAQEDLDKLIQQIKDYAKSNGAPTEMTSLLNCRFLRVEFLPKHIGVPGKQLSLNVKEEDIISFNTNWEKNLSTELSNIGLFVLSDLEKSQILASCMQCDRILSSPEYYQNGKLQKVLLTNPGDGILHNLEKFMQKFNQVSLDKVKDKSYLNWLRNQLKNIGIQDVSDDDLKEIQSIQVKRLTSPAIISPDELEEIFEELEAVGLRDHEARQTIEFEIKNLLDTLELEDKKSQMSLEEYQQLVESVNIFRNLQISQVVTRLLLSIDRSQQTSIDTLNRATNDWVNPPLLGEFKQALIKAIPEFPVHDEALMTDVYDVNKYLILLEKIKTGALSKEISDTQGTLKSIQQEIESFITQHPLEKASIFNLDSILEQWSELTGMVDNLKLKGNELRELLSFEKSKYSFDNLLQQSSDEEALDIEEKHKKLVEILLSQLQQINQCSDALLPYREFMQADKKLIASKVESAIAKGNEVLHRLSEKLEAVDTMIPSSDMSSLILTKQPLRLWSLIRNKLFPTMVPTKTDDTALAEQLLLLNEDKRYAANILDTLHDYSRLEPVAEQPASELQQALMETIQQVDTKIKDISGLQAVKRPAEGISCTSATSSLEHDAILKKPVVTFPVTQPELLQLGPPTFNYTSDRLKKNISPRVWKTDNAENYHIEKLMVLGAIYDQFESQLRSKPHGPVTIYIQGCDELLIEKARTYAYQVAEDKKVDVNLHVHYTARKPAGLNNLTRPFYNLLSARFKKTPALIEQVKSRTEVDQLLTKTKRILP